MTPSRTCRSLGSLFSFWVVGQLAGAITTEVLYTFPQSEFSTVKGPLLEAAEGGFYASTTTGGDFGHGFLFRVRADGGLDRGVSFKRSGELTSGSLMAARTGGIYGHGRYGVVRLTEKGDLATVADFTLATGADLAGALVEGLDQNLYGVTDSGGVSDCGAFVKLSTAGEWTVLAPRDCQTLAGSVSGLTLAEDGSFLGTSSSGGVYRLGSVFRMSAEGLISTVLSFDGTNGAGPTGGVAWASDGRWYGTTTGIDFDRERSLSWGTVFSLTSNGFLNTVHRFSVQPGSATQGVYPRSHLIPGADGSLYGTTSDVDEDGEDLDRGSIFRVATDGVVRTIFRDSVPEMSAWAPEPLIVGRDGPRYRELRRGTRRGNSLSEFCHRD